MTYPDNITAATNAAIRTLGIGARFRSHRNAQIEWQLDRVEPNRFGDVRAYCHAVSDPARVTDCSPAMSVWSDERQELLRTFDEWGTE